MKKQTEITPKDLAMLGVALAFGAIGLALRPVALDIDSAFGIPEIMGVVSLTLFWMTCMAAWAAWIMARLGCSQKYPEFLPGVMAAFGMVSGAALGHLGLLGERYRWLSLSILLLGVAVGSKALGEELQSSWCRIKKWSWPEKGLALFVAGVVCYFGIHALIPGYLTDPMIYHLSGPRIWFDRGRVEMNPLFPTIFLCTYWEYLYLWGQQLLAEPGGRGLYDAMVFSQLIHVWIGFAGSGILIYFISAQWIFNRTVRWSAVIAALGAPFLVFTAFNAKNDWGSILFALLGVRILQLNRRQVLDIAAGFFFGIALGIKLTLFYFVGPFLLCHWIESGFSRRWIWIGIFSLVFVVPLFYRNWMITGLPTFPFSLPGLHSPWLSQSLSRRFSTNGDGVQSIGALYILRDRLSLIAKENILELVFLALLPIGLIFSNFRRNAMLWTLVLSWAVYLMTMRASKYIEDGTLYLRYLAPVLLLSPIFVLSLLSQTSVRRWSVVLAVVVSSVCSVRVWKEHSISGAVTVLTNMASYLRQVHRAGEVKAWLRMNVAPDELVASTGDLSMYFLSHLRFIAMTEQPYLDYFNSAGGDLLRVFEKLDRLGVRYLLSVRHPERGTWVEMEKNVFELAQNIPRTVLVQSKDAVVISTRTAMEEFAHACLLRPTEPAPDYWELLIFDNPSL